MPLRLHENSEKAAVTVSEAAALCGLSRTHFHSLIKAGVFPPPCYDIRTRKPLFALIASAPRCSSAFCWRRSW